MPPRTLKGALIILLVGATASFLDKFASREEFTVGELRKIRHERHLSGHGHHDHCKGQIPRARRDDAAAAARTYLPETWPRERSYASIVADLEVLGSCDAMVGTAASWVSRLIFLLIIGETGRTPPHVFLDQRFGGPADVW